VYIYIYISSSLSLSVLSSLFLAFSKKTLQKQNGRNEGQAADFTWQMATVRASATSVIVFKRMDACAIFWFVVVLHAISMEYTPSIQTTSSLRGFKRGSSSLRGQESSIFL
jgi:hypothetical protein